MKKLKDIFNESLISLRESNFTEVAPPGFEKAVKAMKKEKSVDNPYAVAWSMKNKGYDSSDDMNEADATNVCEECGMIEGHASDCSHMQEADNEHEHEDHDSMDTLGDDVENDACPSCGSFPKDGPSSDCDDPMGCGYWKEFQSSDQSPKTFSISMLKSDISDEQDIADWIENSHDHEEESPDSDSGEQDAEVFSNGLAKRLRWNESSDYDGLALTEASMFDRFDTLVGHRFDGTFDDRTKDITKLRALIRNVVQESIKRGKCAKCGDSVELTANGLATYHNVPGDKFNSCPGSQTKPVSEMKLSVAGPAFGSCGSGEKEDDFEEDLKDDKQNLDSKKSDDKTKNKKKER